jgi:predicted transcriptional regulator
MEHQTPPKDKKRQTTSIRLDPDLWKEIKIQAIRMDIDASEFIERAARQELKRIKQ